MKRRQQRQHPRAATAVQPNSASERARRTDHVVHRDGRPVSLDQLPLVLTQADMSRLLGMSVRSIQEQRARRLFPFPELPDLPRPTWSKAVVTRILDGQGVARSARHLRKVG